MHSRVKCRNREQCARFKKEMQYTHVHSSLIHNSPNVEAKQASIKNTVTWRSKLLVQCEQEGVRAGT